MAAGAEIVRYGQSYADAETEARHLATRDGLLYVHAYDDPAVVAGQSTVGLEILADMPECDVIAVPVRGRGLLAGAAGAGSPAAVRPPYSLPGCPARSPGMPPAWSSAAPTPTGPHCLEDPHQSHANPRPPEGTRVPVIDPTTVRTEPVTPRWRLFSQSSAGLRLNGD